MRCLNEYKRRGKVNHWVRNSSAGLLISFFIFKLEKKNLQEDLQRFFLRHAASLGKTFTSSRFLKLEQIVTMDEINFRLELILFYKEKRDYRFLKDSKWGVLPSSPC